MIVGLAGKMGAGKDFVADVLVKEYGFHRVAFADQIKAVLEEIDPLVEGHDVPLTYLTEWYGGWDEVKKYQGVRTLLQRTGVAMRRLDPDVWVKAAFEHVDPLDRVVVTDVRFENEVRIIQGLRGTVYRVTGRGGSTTSTGSHVSETALDNLKLPEIDNSGTIDNIRQWAEKRFA